MTEYGVQVERPVFPCALPEKLVLETSLSRTLQEEMAHGLLGVTALVTVPGFVATPQLQLRVEAAVPHPESGDGDLLPPVWVAVFADQTDVWLDDSVVGAGV